MKKIVILDAYTINIDDEIIAFFNEYGNVSFYKDNKPEDTLSLTKGCNYLFTDHTYIGREIIESCEQLEYIGIMATGTDSVDLKAATEKSISVTYVPSYSSDSVAQHTFALLLNITNGLSEKLKYVESGKWTETSEKSYWDVPVIELKDKTLGIFGYGNIARKVISMASGFGMRILISTDYADDNKTNNLSFVNRDYLLENSDIITIHKPLRDDNIHMIGKKEFEIMKAGAILINTSRGKLVDELALLEALESGKLKAAGLDTLYHEPPATDDPLVKHPNCYVTPHIAFAGEKSLIKLRDGVKNNYISFLNGEIENLCR